MAQILPAPPMLPAFSFAHTPAHDDRSSIMESSPRRLQGQSSQFCQPQYASGTNPLPAFAHNTPNCDDTAAGPAPRTLSRHSRKTQSVALPNFSFNPTPAHASTTSSTASASTQPIPTPQPPPQGARGHRRIVSEFIGGDSTSQTTPAPINPPIHKALVESSDPVAPSLHSTPSVRKGHRHRRSAALSSQDLSAAARMTAGEAIREKRISRGSPSSPNLSGGPEQLDVSRSGSFKKLRPSPPASKTPSPSRVSFLEKVDIIPENPQINHDNTLVAFPPPLAKPTVPAITRPRSAESTSHTKGPLPADDPTRAKDDLDISGYSGALSAKSMRRHVAPKDSKLSMSNEDRLDGEQPSAMSWSFPTLEAQLCSNFEDGDDEPVAPRDEGDFQFPTSEGSVRLSQNFDLDPTTTVVTEEPKPSSGSVPRVIEDSGKPPITGDDDEAFVDIDAEMQEAVVPGQLSHEESKNLRGQGFSAARKSMHSAMNSGFMAPGMLHQSRTELHRRTESAPSSLVANSTWSELSKLKDSSASQKGFEMSNVFEEDEDDSSPPPPKHVKGSSSPALETGRFYGNSGLWVPDGKGKSTATPLRPLETSTASSPSMSQSQRSASQVGSPSLDGAPSFGSSRHLDLPRGPHPRGPGTNSLPSLIDSQSTITDAYQRQTPSEASPVFPPPATADSNSSSRGWTDTRRKRASVVSLTKLMGIPSAGKSNLSIGQSARCHTSDGLGENQDKKSKSKRVSRMLKFWKSKHLKQG